MRNKPRRKAQPNATLEDFYNLIGRTPKEVSVACVPRAQLINTFFPYRYPNPSTPATQASQLLLTTMLGKKQILLHLPTY